MLEKSDKRAGGTLSGENLFIFMDYVAYCYADQYIERTFNAALLDQEEPEKVLLKKTPI